MLENCTLHYNVLEERMEDFLNTMQIVSVPDKIEKIEEKQIIQALCKNDIIVSTAFTEYMHPIFFLSMELGIPCLIGNTVDFLEENEILKQYLVTKAEDNAIINAKMIKNILENKEKIREAYKNWKQEYDKQAKETIQKFIEK